MRNARFALAAAVAIGDVFSHGMEGFPVPAGSSIQDFSDLA
jgi:hypothetical protein